MHQLGRLPNGLNKPGSGTQAAAVNDHGQVVGSSLNANGESRAVIWQDGKITDLNDLIEGANGVVLTRAVAINNHGQIVVEQEAPEVLPRSFLLAP